MNMAQHKHSKHNNQVRIIGGSCRGRKLNFADADGLRPTPDMVREKLFNWLGQDLTGKTVLDLFCGSGALGVESASRNAKNVVMVEDNRQTAAKLKQNILDWQLLNAEVVCGDGLQYLQQGGSRFDVVFLDPPFAWQQWPQLFSLLKGRLNEGALIYIEAGQLPERPPWLELYRKGKSGLSQFELLLCC